MDLHLSKAALKPSAWRPTPASTTRLRLRSTLPARSKRAAAGVLGPGRKLSRDPAGEFANRSSTATDVNLYGYVGNSPLSARDPLGLWVRNDGFIPVWIAPEEGGPARLLPPTGVDRADGVWGTGMCRFSGQKLGDVVRKFNTATNVIITSQELADGSVVVMLNPTSDTALVDTSDWRTGWKSDDWARRNSWQLPPSALPVSPMWPTK